MNNDKQKQILII